MRNRCNSVHLGNVRAALWDRQAEKNALKYGVPFETFLRERQSTVPMGDFTLAQDVAAAVAFLASEDARHVTGAKLVVDARLVHSDTYRFSVSKAQ